MISYFDIVKSIEDFFERHQQVNQFIDVAQADFNAKENLYISALLVPQQSQIQGQQLNLTFNLFVIDLLNEERSNKRDVFNETLSVLQDFISYFDTRDDGVWGLNDSATTQPVEEKFDDDIIAGWCLTFTVELPFVKNICDIPLEKKIYEQFYRVDNNNPFLYFGEYVTGMYDYDFAYDWFEQHNFTLGPLCSAFRAGGDHNIFGRNFDWEYDNDVDVVIKTSSAKCTGYHSTLGVAHLFKFDKEVAERKSPSNMFRLLPFCIVDGINDAGLYINTNVVPRVDNPGPTTVKEGVFTKRTPMSAVCKELLDNCATVDEAIQRLGFMTIYINRSLADGGNELHWLIGDSTGACVVVEIVNNQLVIMNKDAMTNFYLNGTVSNPDGSYYTSKDVPTHNPHTENGLGMYSQGVERYNIINSRLGNVVTEDDTFALLDDLKYTKAYTNIRDDVEHIWYSEFNGIAGLNIELPTSNFQPTLDSALNRFVHRLRGDEIKTWQTTHSSVYNISTKTLRIKSQEKDIEYKFSL